MAIRDILYVLFAVGVLGLLGAAARDHASDDAGRRRRMLLVSALVFVALVGAFRSIGFGGLQTEGSPAGAGLGVLLLVLKLGLGLLAAGAGAVFIGALLARPER